MWPSAHGYDVTASDAHVEGQDEAFIASAEKGETPTLLHAVAWVVGRAAAGGRT